MYKKCVHSQVPVNVDHMRGFRREKGKDAIIKRSRFTQYGSFGSSLCVRDKPPAEDGSDSGVYITRRKNSDARVFWKTAANRRIRRIGYLSDGSMYKKYDTIPDW